MFEGILTPDEVDALESAQLRAEEARAEHDTWLMVHDNGDGTMSGRFLLPELHGHLLVHALERLTSPRQLSRRRDGAVVTDPTADRLSRAEHFGSAFCELLEHLPADGHNRTAVTLLVTLDLDALVSGVGAARLDTGVRISAGEARRLACGAGLLPAVLGGESLPLDLGRTRRLHTRAQRTALAVVHDSCAVDGCQRPFAWCEIHHPHAWGRGGDTDLANALPLCGHHHRRAHDDRWDLRRHAGGDYRFHRRR